MGRVGVFNYLTVDGFYAGPHGETDWFQSIEKDAEFEKYSQGMRRRALRATGAGNVLVFGRTTYEMMKSYWPTPVAIKNDPGFAKVMNDSDKIVFSRTLQRVEEGPIWKNVTLLHEIRPAEITKLKKRKGLTILGSGTVVQQFANLGLVDEYTFVVVPVILGAGKPMLKDVQETSLKLLEGRAFKNGVLVLRYQPVR
jgi:dihydrofolate reductase